MTDLVTHDYVDAVCSARIEIGEVVEEWTPDEGEPNPMQAYLSVAATLDGKPIKLGVVVGVPDHLQGTARAAGGDTVGPYLSTWWADSTDWQDVPSDRREEAEEALAAQARRLWQTAINSREAQS